MWGQKNRRKKKLGLQKIFEFGDYIDLSEFDLGRVDCTLELGLQKFTVKDNVKVNGRSSGMIMGTGLRNQKIATCLTSVKPKGL